MIRHRANRNSPQKYLQDSDSDGEVAVASRKGSAEEIPDEVPAPAKKNHEVQRVDKAKQNGSGVSWRAFSAGRAEQRNAEIEALQANLIKRGRAISFLPTAKTDDGRHVPLAPALERPGSLQHWQRRIGNGRVKSPPRRAADTKPKEDEMADRELAGGSIGLCNSALWKTDPFTGESTA